jgi:hypothetical protein
MTFKASRGDLLDHEASEQVQDDRTENKCKHMEEQRVYWYLTAYTVTNTPNT